MKSALVWMIGLLLAVSGFLYAGPLDKEDSLVVATTSWTAAFARAAGIENIRVLAPYELQHPPEYELRPSDIEAVSRATLIIYAGYEVMVKRLTEAVGAEHVKLVQITTDHRMETIRQSVRKIAGAAGTEERAEKNLREIEAFFDGWKREIAVGTPVLVHFFQRPLAEELGFEIAGVFGPAPLEARQIAELSGKNPGLIIDNRHNPIGSPLKETLPGVPYVLFINFPGSEEEGSLLDVLRSNREALRQVFSSR